MNFNKHLELEGKHALLGASQYHWLNYSDEKLIDYFKGKQATEMGTKLHELAKSLIELKQKLPRSNKTLNMYVNDAIGFNMKPEVVLYYSPFCFGTCDSISIRNNVLRIHDLKTGATPAHMEQLFIYVSLFCLEYGHKPGDFDDIVTRIYQNDEVVEVHPRVEDIVPIMDKIIHFDKILRQNNLYEGGY